MNFISQILSNSNSSVTINGKTYVGNNISISSGGKVVIDGVAQDGEYLVGHVYIEVKGNVDKLQVSAGSVEVNGSCGAVTTQSGDVRCWDVAGSVSTMTGDVTAKSIVGNVSTMSGSIIR